MQITVLGATGRTGVPLVSAAVGRGHHVRALVRSADKAATVLGPPDGWEVVVGDLADPAALAEAVAGADAVVDVTGPGRGSPPDLRRRAVGPLLTALAEAHVDRLVALTGAGVRADGDRPTVPDRLIRGIMSVVARSALADGTGYAEAIRRSGTDWTIVRAPRLVEAPARGSHRVVEHLGDGVGTTLGRADLAAFLLEVVEQGSYRHACPVVSW